MRPRIISFSSNSVANVNFGRLMCPSTLHQRDILAVLPPRNPRTTTVVIERSPSVRRQFLPSSTKDEKEEERKGRVMVHERTDAGSFLVVPPCHHTSSTAVFLFTLMNFLLPAKYYCTAFSPIATQDDDDDDRTGRTCKI